MKGGGILAEKMSREDKGMLEDPKDREWSGGGGHRGERAVVWIVQLWSLVPGPGDFPTSAFFQV